jgi:hypothetical protein
MSSVIKKRLIALEASRKVPTDHASKYLGTVPFNALVTALEDGAPFAQLAARLDDLE